LHRRILYQPPRISTPPEVGLRIHSMSLAHTILRSPPVGRAMGLSPSMRVQAERAALAQPRSPASPARCILSVAASAVDERDHGEPPGGRCKSSNLAHPSSERML